MYIRYLSRFFDCWAHKTTYAYIGNKHFFTKSFRRQTYQNSKIILQKMPIFDFQSEFSMSKIIRIFLIKNFIEEYQFSHTFFVKRIFCWLQFLNHFITKMTPNFWQNRHLMETQNLVISFDYSRFLAKNLAYAECRIMKFHYRNSSNVHSLHTSDIFIFLTRVILY